MSTHAKRLFVVTGGPGSGKSTLIEALKHAGYRCMPEAGRSIIQDQVLIGGSALPWQDRLAYADLMLSWDMRSYRLAQEFAGTVFFDRGIPDIVGYLLLIGEPLPKYLERAAAHFRYAKSVFIAPPWPEIFEQDTERKQSLDEAIRTYDAMVTTYTGYGYSLIEIPRLPVSERVQFVINNLA